MPRVALKHTDYQIKDFTSKVKGRCAELGLHQFDLAEQLSITPQALSQKMKKGNYTLKDYFKIIEFLKMEG